MRFIAVLAFKRLQLLFGVKLFAAVFESLCKKHEDFCGLLFKLCLV